MICDLVTDATYLDGVVCSGWEALVDIGGGLLVDEGLVEPRFLQSIKDTIAEFGSYMVLVVILAGPESVGAYSGGTNYLIYGLLKALGFTAGVMVLLQGVRMLLGELVPAFKGIADKLVPNAIPALDVPALFGFAPNSLMLGFIFATIGMIVAMFISSALFGVVPLVSIIGAFFTGGVAGTGHGCIDAMAVMTAMYKPVVGIIIIVAVFILACELEARRQKNLAAAGKK